MFFSSASKNFNPAILPPPSPAIFGSIVSESICFTKYPIYGFLSIDDFNNNVNDGFYGAFTSSILNKNILARISIQGNGNNIVSQNNLSLITTPRQYFGPVDIQRLHIALYDEFGRIIDLNYMDWSMELMFECVYS